MPLTLASLRVFSVSPEQLIPEYIDPDLSLWHLRNCEKFIPKREKRPAERAFSHLGSA